MTSGFAKGLLNNIQKWQICSPKGLE